MQSHGIDPVVILIAAVAAGAVFLGIGIYIRNHVGGENLSALGVIWALLVIAPLLAGAAYYARGIDWKPAHPSYASSGTPDPYYPS